MRYFVLTLAVIAVSCSTPVDQATDIGFKKHILYDEFVTEGIAIGDVNQDGLTDIMSGPFWFEAPKWKKHEIREPRPFDHTQGWSDSFLNFSLDVNEDGWIDLVTIDFPGTPAIWFENPKNKAGYWKKHLIDSTARNESPMLMDVDADGKQELVFGSGNKEMKWFKPVLNRRTFWSAFSLSEADAPGTDRFSHGLGSGDLNKDGKTDVLVADGWWQAPEDPQTIWKFHEVSLGAPCSQMQVYDFDDDGDNDVLTCSAHNYGIWWHEQISAPDGSIAFKQHLIDSTFSQTHATALVDINADGLPDLITGKRYFAHNGKDPGGLDPQVLYWFELQRDENNQPYWIPHLIDNSSGVGLQVIVDDVNKDGLKDILVGNKKGIFYFEGELSDKT